MITSADIFVHVCIEVIEVGMFFFFLLIHKKVEMVDPIEPPKRARRLVKEDVK